MLKDFKVRYHAIRSFQLDLTVFTDFEKGKTFSVVGEYQSVPEGLQVDAIMQMYLDTRTSNWTNSDNLFRTYQNSYAIFNQEKDLGTIELKGAMTDMQVERLKDFLMLEDREFIATYHDYRPEKEFVMPEIKRAKVILQSIDYQEIGNNNTYNVNITLSKLTNWNKKVNYSTAEGNISSNVFGTTEYDYTYDFKYGADAGDAGSLIFSTTGNGGNEKAPFILEIMEPTTDMEFYFVSGTDEQGNNIVLSGGKIFGSYNAVAVVSGNITDQVVGFTKQGIYVKNVQNEWVEIDNNNLDYTKDNFFNLPVGSNNLVIKGFDNTDVKNIIVSLTVYEQYRIEGA